jgi:beta-lactamase regulating signal transducer with metallopeptidase domain
MIAPVFYKLLYMSVTALAVGIIIMLIRRFADKRFSPFWKYAMWALVLVALVMPWRPQSTVAVMNTTERIQDVSFHEAYTAAEAEYHIAVQEEPARESSAPAPSERLTAAKTKADSLHVKTILFDNVLPALWLFGMVVIGLFMLLGGLRLGRNIKQSALPFETDRYDTILRKCKRKLGMTRHVQIIVQRHVKSPAQFDLLRPKIILPDYAARMSDEHVEYIILHELSHLKRGDSFVNALLLALQTVYWFNPLTWLLFRFIREDMELANDAAVLKGMGEQEQRTYSLLLVEVLAACGRPPLAPRLLCMVDSEKNMTRRINMIKLGEFFKRRRLVIAVCAVALIVGTAIIFLTASGGAGTEKPADAPKAAFKTYILETLTRVSIEPLDLDDETAPLSIALAGEEPTDRDRNLMTQMGMSAVSLYDDGTARLSMPVTNSYLPPSCEYSIDGTSLVLRATSKTIESSSEKDAVIVKNEKIIARFEIIDDNTLVLRAASVPLFADIGARYVHTPFTGTISIVVQKGNDGEPGYSLFNYEPKSSFACLFDPHQWFENVESLNAALAEYAEGSIETVYVKHTDEFTKKEMLKITDALIIPSKNFRMTTGEIDAADDAEERPPTLEQSISLAILEKDWGHSPAINAELHKTLHTEETDGTIYAYVLVEVNSMGWTSGFFTSSSGGVTPCIISFKKNDDGSFKAANIQEVDLKEDSQLYAAFEAKTGLDKVSFDTWELLRPANTKFAKYLPKGVFTEKYLTDFKEGFGSDGSIYYYWNKMQDSEVVRKIELELCDEGVARFHFKDYGIDDGYVYTSQRIGKDTAGEMAQSFAKDFWADGEKFTFKNTGEGSSSLYDPGNVENWQAEYKGKTYDVMVDLQFGYVVYAGIEE